MYNGVKVFDVHSHVARPAPSNLFATSMLASNAASPSPFSGTGHNPATEQEYRKAADGHIAYMDVRNIDVQLLGPQPFLMFGWMPDHLLPSWTAYINDCIAQEVGWYPERFIGAAQLPQNARADDTRHVLPELRRCVDELGFQAVYVSPDPTGHRDSPGLAVPYWHPLFEVCQERGLPIIIHGSACQDPRIRNIPANYQIGFLIEQYIATEILQKTDVFDRFPELRVVVCHCGGALDRFLPEDRHLTRDLAENLWFDTCAHDMDFIATAIKQRGVAQMIFGTEARGQNPGMGKRALGLPGISGDDLVPVISSYDFLTEEDKITIFNTNPVKFLPGFAKV